MASTATASIYDTITNQIIAALERGTGDYTLPWHRSGSVCLNSDWQKISGSSAGFVALPRWVVLQGGRSPTGETAHLGCQIHAATARGGLSKYI